MRPSCVSTVIKNVASHLKETSGVCLAVALWNKNRHSSWLGLLLCFVCYIFVKNDEKKIRKGLPKKIEKKIQKGLPKKCYKI